MGLAVRGVASSSKRSRPIRRVGERRLSIRRRTGLHCRVCVNAETKRLAHTKHVRPGPRRGNNQNKPPTTGVGLKGRSCCRRWLRVCATASKPGCSGSVLGARWHGAHQHQRVPLDGSLTIFLARYHFCHRRHVLSPLAKRIMSFTCHRR
jgi:hypothetical protein